LKQGRAGSRSAPPTECGRSLERRLSHLGYREPKRRSDPLTPRDGWVERIGTSSEVNQQPVSSFVADEAAEPMSA
jgi:hypothetical protein